MYHGTEKNQLLFIIRDPSEYFKSLIWRPILVLPNINPVKIADQLPHKFQEKKIKWVFWAEDALLPIVDVRCWYQAIDILNVYSTKHIKLKAPHLHSELIRTLVIKLI